MTGNEPLLVCQPGCLVTASCRHGNTNQPSGRNDLRVSSSGGGFQLWEPSENQAVFGTGVIGLIQSAVSLSVSYWVPKGLSRLYLRGSPGHGGGHEVYKSLFNMNVPVAFVVKSKKYGLHTLIFIHRRVQTCHRGEWAKKPSTCVTPQSRTTLQMPATPWLSIVAFK